MAKNGSFKVGEAPWEKESKPGSFPVGQAPWELAEKPAPAPQDNAGQAAIEGFGQGASLGYLPQLQAATYMGAKKLADTLGLGDDTDAKLKAAGFDIQQGPESYTALRDENIARQEQLKASNPYSYGAGEIAGGITTGVAASPLMPAPAASITGRIAQAGKIGGVVGAIANPGDKAGEVNISQVPDRLRGALKSGAIGAATGGILESPNMVRRGANAARNAIAKRLGANVDYTPIANKAEVEAAAKRLGIDDLPSAVLTDNKTYQKLESGLSQSGSFPAKTVRDKYGKLFKGLESAAEKIDSLKTADSSFGAGSKIGKDLAAQVKKNVEPVEELYKDLNPLLQKIDVDKQAVNSQFGALKRNPIFQTKDGKAMLADYQEAVHSVGDLASLKEFRSNLHGELKGDSSPLDAKRIDAIYDAVTKIRDRSVHATKVALPKGAHGEVDALINQIGLADAAHASNLGDINSIKSLVGNKEFKSPSSFLSKLSEMKESDLADKASSLDVATLRNIKEKFPSVFEKVKTAKINDMVQNSTNPVSGFNDARFLKQWDGLDKEARELLFDPKMHEHIEAFKTLKQSLPERLGPSGTPEGLHFMQMFDPKRNALDYGIKKTLESAKSPGGAVSGKPVSGTSISAGRNAATVSNRPVYEGSSRPTLPKDNPASAESEPRGRDKWANDGLKKLKEHSRDPASFGEIDTTDPKIKDLLIQASDLKPGSKGMERVLERIRQYGNAPTKR